MRQTLPYLCGVATVVLASAISLQAHADAHAPGAVDDGWGTIKGQIVFAGATVPKAEELNVDKNQDHCLAKGPILSRTWTVNPQTKGVRYAVVFLKPEPGQTLPVNPEAPALKQDKVVLDQPMCHFEPHILAMHKDQKLVVKNPAPIAHNIVIAGFKNNHNIQMGPGSEDRAFTLVPENNPIGLSCGAHPWMKGSLWVFAHPYYAVTDANGNFEIRNVPAGTRFLVTWHEAKGYFGGADREANRKGRQIVVPVDGTVDVGKIEISP